MISDFFEQPFSSYRNESSMCDGVIGMNSEEDKKKRDIFIIFSEKFFIKISGPYVTPDLFVLEEDSSIINKNSSLIKAEDLLRELKTCESDADFGQVYGVIGEFVINNIRGFLILLSLNVAKDLFKSSTPCHAIQFKVELIKKKLDRRISRTAGLRREYHNISHDSLTVVRVTSFTNGNPIIVDPILKKQPLKGTALKVVWDSLFSSEIISLITSNRVDLKNTRKKTLIKVAPRTQFSKLLENKKIEGLVSRGFVIGDSVLKLKALTLSDKINLREETISLGEKMFSIKWCPQKFTEAFCEFENICKGGSQVVSAVTASILMDPSFRIIDCEAFDDNVIGTASVDLDQLIIKFNLQIIESELFSEDQLLLKWYTLLAPLFTETKNATTNFSPTSMRSNCHKGGSSLDESVESKKYVTLLTHGITSEVLNLSYRRRFPEVADVEECIKASLIVMKFLFQSEHSKFRNENSIDMLNAACINWNHAGKQSSENFHVSGGLLFQFLTLFLLSFRGKEAITVCIETYGGKKRGEKVSWDCSNRNEVPSSSYLKEIFEEFRSSEENKIAFQIRKIVKGVIYFFPGCIGSVSTHVGLGCDARGKELQNGHPSFLVCQPTSIKEIESSRLGETKFAFAKGIDGGGNSISRKSDSSYQTRSIAQGCDQIYNDSEHFSQEGDENHNIRSR